MTQAQNDLAESPFPTEPNVALFSGPSPSWTRNLSRGRRCQSDFSKENHLESQWEEAQQTEMANNNNHRYLSHRRPFKMILSRFTLIKGQFMQTFRLV